MIELIIAVAILAILIAVTAPTFGEIALRNRSTNAINSLMADLALARSEAVKRARNASVSAAGNWNDGWVVWADDNNDNVMDATEMLKEQGAINKADTDVSIHFALSAVEGATAGGAAASQIAFGPMGETVLPAAGARFALCRPDGDAAKSVGIQIDRSGRAASQRDLATIGLGC